MSQSHSFEFTCPTPGCGHVYRATPELVGRTILCKECKQKVKVPAVSNRRVTTSRPTTPSPSAARRAPSAPPPPRTSTARPATTPVPVPTDTEQAQCPSCQAMCRIRPEWRGATLRCPSCKQQFVVPESEAAFVAEAVEDDDVGYSIDEGDDDAAIAVEPPADAYGLDDQPQAPAYSDYQADAGPVMERGTSRKKKRRRDESFVEKLQDLPLWVKAVAGVGLLAVVGAIAFAAAGGAAIGWALAGAGFLTMVVGGTWIVVLAFQESVVCGLIYLLDCTGIYRLYFLITRWDDTKRPFFVSLVGAALCAPLFLMADADDEGMMGGFDEFDDEAVDAPMFPGAAPGDFMPPANSEIPAAPAVGSGQIPGSGQIGQPSDFPSGPPSGVPTDPRSGPPGSGP